MSKEIRRGQGKKKRKDESNRVDLDLCEEMEEGRSCSAYILKVSFSRKNLPLFSPSDGIFLGILELFSSFLRNDNTEVCEAKKKDPTTRCEAGKAG